MHSPRAFTLIQGIAGLALTVALARAFALPMSVPWDALVVFGLAYIVLGAFGVWLPRGDPADTTGAVALAAGLILWSPLLAAAVIVVSRSVLAAIRPRRGAFFRMVDDTGRHLLALGIVEGLYFLLLSGRAPVDQAKYLVVAAAVIFFAVDFLLVQSRASIRLGSSLAGLVVGNLRLQGWMTAAEVCAAVLCVLIYGSLTLLGVVIVVCLLLVMRQAFALFMEVRLAYRSTVEVLARAMGAEDPDRRGHGERVAILAASTGRVLGMHGVDLENLHYAALFHDVGTMSRGVAGDPASAASSAHVLANVGFLSKAVPILRALEAQAASVDSESQGTLVSAYIVARMSDFDDQIAGSSVSGPRPSAESGARLYAETRARVDRAILRVQELVRVGALSLDSSGENLP